MPKEPAATAIGEVISYSKESFGFGYLNLKSGGIPVFSRSSRCLPDKSSRRFKIIRTGDLVSLWGIGFPWEDLTPGKVTSVCTVDGKQWVTWTNKFKSYCCQSCFVAKHAKGEILFPAKENK